MEFGFPPTLKLANLPTPVERMRDVPELPDLPNVYVKRDDLTGSALSGNKVRKLEFAFAEAAEMDARTVVTCGGIQSNHARATAIAAARLGLRPVLVLRGAAPAESDGNVLLDRLAGAEIRFISPEEWPHVNEIMAEIAAGLGSAGEKAYVIPEGASYPPGVFGYIKAAQEIAAAEKELGIEFDTIVTAVGSGGTTAGLIYGKRIFGLKGNVLGINVLDTPEYFARRIAAISEAFIVKYENRYRGASWLKPILPGDVEIAGGYDGPAYAVPTEEGLGLIRTCARRLGLFLDPAYTGKAMLGLAGEAAKGRWRKSDNVLFIHTGGIFSLFPWRKELASSP
ncbi:MAG: D-cysteine desulfhydrase family protein [Candidatus Krumholzibacteria bacterium]|nr:D-cysteine desulfhydrase family protein [Candidatus Krumholzibacteria bacterium]